MEAEASESVHDLASDAAVAPRVIVEAARVACPSGPAVSHSGPTQFAG